MVDNHNANEQVGSGNSAVDDEKINLLVPTPNPLFEQASGEDVISKLPDYILDTATRQTRILEKQLQDNPHLITWHPIEATLNVSGRRDVWEVNLPTDRRILLRRRGGVGSADNIYCGTFSHLKKGRAYFIIDGSSQQLPRRADDWCDIPISLLQQA